MLQDGTFRDRSLPKTVVGSGLDGVGEGLYLKKEVLDLSMVPD